MKKSLPRLDSKFIVIAISVLLLLYFIVMPLLVLIYDSLFINGVFDISNYKDVYGKKVNWKALTNTIQLSLIVMVASVIVTFPLAWLVGRTDLPGKKTFRTVLVASYMIPPYVGAIAWVQLLNPSVGYLNEFLKFIFGLQKAPFDIYTMGGLAWVLTLFYSPFAFITISRAMEKMDPTLEEAARISGSSPLKTLWDVTLPLMMPSIVAGGLLVFIAAASCFGIPAIVGMPGNIEVMTTRIVTFLYMGDDKGIRDATALAVSMMVVANGLLMFMSWMLSHKDYTTISGKSTRPNMVELGKWKWPAFAVVAGYAFIAVILPLSSIVVTSFLVSMSKGLALDNFGIDAWIPVVTSSQYMESVWRSIGYGIVAACIGTVLALFVAYLSVKTNITGRSIPDLLVVLGGATPSIVIALALIVTFSGNYGLNLYSTMWILIVSYLVKYMTMSVRTIAASLSQVHISLEEAALSSGASWIRTCKDIIMPLVAPSIVAGWFLIFMPSFYELTMSNLLYGADTKSLGVLLYELQTYADTQNASVLSVIILLIVLIGNIILNKVTKGKVSI
ncbi:ABC transporter permease [Succiniclasticum ruminis]|uniref:Iron(III) transport system permease protein n=1 Tax=Succiniclasticum ruminis DSM 9236 TaxID=1123323 RepID=A0A1I2CSZ7_9FIRM|nr:iron ABC transporter permease [Succiniclasticum ruminis]SFE71378.1 iron(III) transport system permease protein [Succiniclasticum ruminis DSM 9236]